MQFGHFLTSENPQLQVFDTLRTKGGGLGLQAGGNSTELRSVGNLVELSAGDDGQRKRMEEHCARAVLARLAGSAHDAREVIEFSAVKAPHRVLFEARHVALANLACWIIEVVEHVQQVRSQNRLRNYWFPLASDLTLHSREKLFLRFFLARYQFHYIGICRLIC